MAELAGAASSCGGSPSVKLRHSAFETEEKSSPAEDSRQARESPPGARYPHGPSGANRANDCLNGAAGQSAKGACRRAGACMQTSPRPRDRRPARPHSPPPCEPSRAREGRTHNGVTRSFRFIAFPALTTSRSRRRWGSSRRPLREADAEHGDEAHPEGCQGR